jgi:uncharacterized protein (UPF0212 family)
MGLYNLVVGRLTCPRCGTEVEAEVETRLGYVHQVLTLRVGDRYPWGHPDLAADRPTGGNAVGEGYGECPACHKDFFTRIVVEADVIMRLDPDTARRGMIPDDG